MGTSTHPTYFKFGRNIQDDLYIHLNIKYSENIPRGTHQGTQFRKTAGGPPWLARLQCTATGPTGTTGTTGPTGDPQGDPRDHDDHGTHGGPTGDPPGDPRGDPIQKDSCRPAGVTYIPSHISILPTPTEHTPIHRPTLYISSNHFRSESP